jgi:hypothetical protein
MKKKPPEPSVRKRAHETAIRINISLPPVLFDASQRLIKDGGYSGLSDYVQDRIRTDADMKPTKRMAA